MGNQTRSLKKSKDDVHDDIHKGNSENSKHVLLLSEITSLCSNVSDKIHKVFGTPREYWMKLSPGEKKTTLDELTENAPPRKKTYAERKACDSSYGLRERIQASFEAFDYKQGCIAYVRNHCNVDNNE